jgi:hypothetical protein
MACVGTFKGQICSEQGTHRGGDLQEHPNADVGEAFFEVRGGCARGGRDYRNQRCADGVANIDVERKV